MTGGVGLVCSAICSCACLAGVITMISYFGIYGLNNPDPQAYYGLVGGAQTLAATAKELTDAGVVEPFPVHDKMVSWFLWGFILNIAPFAACFCMLPTILLPNLAQLFSCFASLLMTFSGCGSLAWFITGSVFRFRSDFNFASGDVIPAGVDSDAWYTALEADSGLFQVSSGRFMWVFLMINYGTMAASCGCALLVGICSCVAGMLCK